MLKTEATSWTSQKDFITLNILVYTLTRDRHLVRLPSFLWYSSNEQEFYDVSSIFICANCRLLFSGPLYTMPLMPLKGKCWSWREYVTKCKDCRLHCLNCIALHCRLHCLKEPWHVGYLVLLWLNKKNIYIYIYWISLITTIISNDLCRKVCVFFLLNFA